MVRGKSQRIGDWIICGVLLLLAACCLFPLLYVVSVSLTPYSEIIRTGGFILIPRVFSLQAYEKLWEYSGVFRSLGVTVYITVIGTLISLFLSVLLAYPLSKRDIPGIRIFTFMTLIPLLFSGGLIPTYLVVKSLGLLNTPYSIILPTAVWSSNVFIMRTFFLSLPTSLFESCRIDGASEFRILWSIALPLSLPMMATMGLFYAVGLWNNYLSAIIYITDHDMRPLQVVVREILMLTQENLNDADQVVPAITMQMASVVFASLPIIIVYPFLQRFFVKGVMLGAIKG